MFELIKAEMKYKKWEHMVSLLMPFLLWPLFWWLFFQGEENSEEGITFCAMAAYAATLILVAIRTPMITHNTNLEEHRIQLFASLPVSLRSVALSQSLPFLLLSAGIALSGFAVVGMLSGGFVELSIHTMVNCVLLAMSLGLFSVFIKEVLTLLPKWVPIVLWISFLALIFARSRIDSALSPNWRIFDPSQLTNWIGSIKLGIMCGVFFLGHLALFTHFRTDLSARRRPM